MKRIDEVISKIEEFLLSFSILAMAAVLIAGVVARTVFNSSLTFTEEIGQALNTAVTFLGIGYCAREARHISMSVVFDLVNIRFKKLLMCVITLLTGIIMLYLAYLSLYYTVGVYNLGRVTAALRIPMWIIYIPVSIGFFAGGVEYIRAFVMNIKNKDEVYISSKLKLGENMDNMGIEEEEVTDR